MSNKEAYKNVKIDYKNRKTRPKIYNKIIQIKVSEYQYEQIKKQAKTKNVSVSQYIRNALNFKLDN